MKKPIITSYFSRPGSNYVSGQIVNLSVGNTKVAAIKIQEMTGGELFKINQAHKYSDDYNTCSQEAKQELRVNARPKLTYSFDSIDGFEIIIPYPNWWGTIPMPVWEFLESHDFRGKTIFPICIHGTGWKW